MAQTIDIDAIVRGRMGNKERFLPRFVTRWLARFIHQDEINDYLCKGKVGVDFCLGVTEHLGVSIEVSGTQNLPEEGLCTFVSNHPLGAIDGVALGGILGQHYDGRIKYLVNDLLMNLEGLAPLCIPINKIGRQASGFAKSIDEAFRSDNHIIMFPAGLCSRKQKDGSIRDIDWKPTFIKKSVQTGRRVVPIRFVAENSPRFYRVAQWCKRLHLPNFAMALLPDEMFRVRGSHFGVIIGKPIEPDTFDRSRTAAQWAQWVKAQVYELRKEPASDEAEQRAAEQMSKD